MIDTKIAERSAYLLGKGDSVVMSMMRAVFVVSCGAVALTGCGDRQVSFKNDVTPILKTYCIECHNPSGKGFAQSGLLLDSYEDVMKGTKFGPVVKPGSGLTSPLDQVLEGRVDKSIRMPHGGKPIPEKEIKTIRAWVDQGAKNN